MTMKTNRIVSMVLLTFLFLSCKEKEPVMVQSVSLNKTSLSMIVGDSETLIATVSPADAVDASVSWSSSNPSIASVQGGIITALSEGTTSIIASAGGKSSSCSVSVSPKVIPVTSITLSQNTVDMVEGDKVTITASVEPSDASDKTIIWSSSDENIVSVNHGELTAKTIGSAVITASAGDKSATCTVSVVKKVIHVESVIVNISEKRLKINEEFPIQVKIFPETANDYSIVYTSDNVNTATVSESGIITGKSSGNATITVEADGKKADIAIKVFEKDLVYAMAVDWSGNDCYSTLWKDKESNLTASGISFDALYFINNQTWIVAEKNKVSYPYEFYYIKDGSYTSVNTGDTANRNIVYSSAQNGDDIYALVEWVYDSYDSKRAIWKNETKLYDIGDESKMSQYSYCAFGNLFFYEGDMYMSGEIMEPVSETAKASYATLWKNGKIHKQFDVRGSDSTWGGSILDVEIIDGKFYYLIVRSNRGWANKIAVYDDNGKLYDLCYESDSSSGKLASYNGKLYAAILSTYSESPNQRLSVFEDGELLYSIPEVSAFAMDVIDGDFYFLTSISRRWGGDYYNSLKVYRNETPEYTLCEEGVGSYTAVQLKVFPER